MYTEITKCRISDSTNLINVLSLGNQYLTGVFPKKIDENGRSPIPYDETQPATYKVDTWTSFHHDKERIINALISDEEIEKAKENAWSDYEYQEGNLYSTTFSDGWLMAIDWYKKQLNSK
jgi:hypothetical protein